MAFKVLVCAKQVPDTNEIKINPETGTLIRDGVPSILNPDDANALEEALKLKSDFLITLCEVIAGGLKGLENDEKGIIDACIRQIYEMYFYRRRHSRAHKSRNSSRPKNSGNK